MFGVISKYKLIFHEIVIISFNELLQGNQDNLHKEIDQYQHELTALQSSYSQKISNLNKKHKQELQNLQDEKQEYLQRIEELEGRLLNPDGVCIMSA